MARSYVAFFTEKRQSRYLLTPTEVAAYNNKIILANNPIKEAIDVGMPPPPRAYLLAPQGTDRTYMAHFCALMKLTLTKVVGLSFIDLYSWDNYTRYQRGRIFAPVP